MVSSPRGGGGVGYVCVWYPDTRRPLVQHRILHVLLCTVSATTDGCIRRPLVRRRTSTCPPVDDKCDYLLTVRVYEGSWKVGSWRGFILGKGFVPGISYFDTASKYLVQGSCCMLYI